MQDKIVGIFDPLFAEKGKTEKSRVYMNRLVQSDMEKQNRCSPQCFCDGSCKKENPMKALEELFMGMKQEESKTTEGIKYNDGKPQLSLLFTQFPKALKAIVKCSEYGHKKYNKNGEDSDYLNFKRVEGGSSTYADAGLRHRLYEKGTTDLDSQLPHAYHVAWNALAELELILENR